MGGLRWGVLGSLENGALKINWREDTWMRDQGRKEMKQAAFCTRAHICFLSQPWTPWTFGRVCAAVLFDVCCVVSHARSLNGFIVGPYQQLHAKMFYAICSKFLIYIYIYLLSAEHWPLYIFIYAASPQSTVAGLPVKLLFCLALDIWSYFWPQQSENLMYRGVSAQDTMRTE